MRFRRFGKNLNRHVPLLYRLYWILDMRFDSRRCRDSRVVADDDRRKPCLSRI